MDCLLRTESTAYKKCLALAYYFVGTIDKSGNNITLDVVSIRGGSDATTWKASSANWESEDEERSRTVLAPSHFR